VSDLVQPKTPAAKSAAANNFRLMCEHRFRVF
jgi:hypothetical protein